MMVLFWLVGLFCFSSSVEDRGFYLFQVFPIIESRQTFPYFKIPYQNAKKLRKCHFSIPLSVDEHEAGQELQA